MCMSLEQSLASSKASFGLLKFDQEAHHGTTVKPERLANRRWSEVFEVYTLYMYESYMGVSKNRGTPKWMVFNGKPY